MLGWLPGVGDLDGTQYNSLDPANPNSQRVMVGQGADYCTYPDPDHSFTGTEQQMFAPNTPPVSGITGATMNGFVENYVKDKGTPQTIMNCFSPEQVPVISSLAQNFRACTRYHASVPGPTGPNRIFQHAGTSMGYNGGVYDGYPVNATTIYELLMAANESWAIHYHDFTSAHGLYPLNTHVDHFIQENRDESFSEFFDTIDNGTLRSYTFLVPLLSPFVTKNGSLNTNVNTEHPFTDIRRGEALIKSVYEKLRSSSYWNDVLLIVNYDEHGGFWDSAMPVPAVNPTPSATSHPTPFGFDRLGIRVPAIVISPWIPAGTDDTVYDHTSVLATVRNVFGLPRALYARDAVANRMDQGLLSQPRTDCPMTLPDVPTSPPLCLMVAPEGGPSDLAREYMHMYRVLLEKRGLGEQFVAAAATSGHTTSVEVVESDFEAGLFLRSAIKVLFQSGRSADSESVVGSDASQQ